MYEVPAPEDYKAFLKAHNLTSAQAAAFAGVSPRAARRWVAPAEQKGARAIPWAAWALIRIFAGDISAEELRRQIETAALIEKAQ
jgi:hypothetical protein